VSTFTLKFEPLDGITGNLGATATNLDNNAHQLHAQANRLAGQQGFGIQHLQRILMGLARDTSKLGADVSLIKEFVTALGNVTQSHEDMAFQELSGGIEIGFRNLKAILDGSLIGGTTTIKDLKWRPDRSIPGRPKPPFNDLKWRPGNPITAVPLPISALFWRPTPGFNPLEWWFGVTGGPPPTGGIPAGLNDSLSHPISALFWRPIPGFNPLKWWFEVTGGPPPTGGFR